MKSERCCCFTANNAMNAAHTQIFLEPFGPFGYSIQYYNYN
jgi:hypothetical protein